MVSQTKIYGTKDNNVGEVNRRGLSSANTPQTDAMTAAADKKLVTSDCDLQTL